MAGLPRAILAACLALAFAAVPLVRARADDGAWLRTVAETSLWSGPTDPAEQFTTVPPGTSVMGALPATVGRAGRTLVYYPGDGLSRQPGQAWIASSDLAADGPPAWVASSEVDQPGSAAVHRVAYLAPPVVTAHQVAVLDDDSGLLLYGRAAHARAAPASTTKIVTAMVALQHIESLDRTVQVDVDGWKMAAADGSSVMGLVPGQRLSLRTLLFGLLLPSGNDAAEQLAHTLAPSRQHFIAWMNQAVASAGLTDTHFANPSGLDAQAHYSSAYDLAHLARLALQDEAFASIVASSSYTADGFTLIGHNPLLGAYPGADGVKTGTTDAAGHALVGSAVRDGHRVLVVVLHADDTLADATALFDWVWQSFAW
jgi:D-alanyl-D-alanine carboxypeptidase